MSFFLPPRPYPPEQYTADSGKVDAYLRRAETEHDVVNRTGSADYLATGDLTGGSFGLYRWNMGPEPSGPGPHFHKTITESFFVISGAVRLFDGSSWQDGRPGDFLHIAQGGLHGFRNESGEDASMLILFTPGAPREKYFEGLAHLALGGERPSEEELDEFYLRHDNFT